MTTHSQAGNVLEEVQSILGLKPQNDRHRAELTRKARSIIVETALDFLRDQRFSDAVALEVQLRTIVHELRRGRKQSLDHFDDLTYLFATLDTMEQIARRTIDGDVERSPEDSTLAGKIVKMLDRSNDWMSTSSLATRLESHAASIARLLPALRAQGKVVSRRSGREMQNWVPGRVGERSSELPRRQIDLNKNNNKAGSAKAVEEALEGQLLGASIDNENHRVEVLALKDIKEVDKSWERQAINQAIPAIDLIGSKLKNITINYENLGIENGEFDYPVLLAPSDRTFLNDNRVGV
jgi:hypothetical protein